MIALAEILDAPYRAWLEQTLRADDVGGAAGLGPAELERRTRFAVGKARSHGLDDARSIAGFVLLLFATHPGFDEDPRVRALLREGDGGPEDRLRRAQAFVATQGPATSASAEDAWAERLAGASSGSAT